MAHRLSVLFILAISTALLTCTLPQELAAQTAETRSFDYAMRPPMPYHFTNLDLDLTLDDGLKLKGEATYRFRPTLRSNEPILLHAAHMDLSGITLDGAEVEYRASNDTLLIIPDDTLAAAQDYRLRIIYTTEPRFGLLKDYDGTIRTSFLPKSHRHWMPVFDHPRNSLNLTLNVTRPNGGEVIRTEADKPVPVTGIGFAIGSFEREETLVGIRTVALHSPIGKLSQDEKSRYLRTAYRTVSEVQSLLNQEPPFQTLHLVLLEDHQWERKSYGAGMGFIYRNKGNIEAQIRRIVLAQWLGVMKREEQWLEARSTHLLQSTLASLFTDSDSFEKSPEGVDEPNAPATLYEQFSDTEWYLWTKAVKRWEATSTPLLQAAKKHLTDFVAEGEEVYDWMNLADFLYRQTGYRLYDIPQLQTPASPDTILYDVTVSEDEMAGRIYLRFQAKDSTFNELANARLTLIYGDHNVTENLTFSGKTDSLAINPDGLPLNIFVIPADSLPIAFDLHKPFSYWLHQLRSAESTADRAAAADKLSEHAENPDLQLAMLDILSNVEAPQVKAGLLSTLAVLTDGGVGTEQHFIKALGSESTAVRLAGLRALGNYPGNEQAIRNARRWALRGVQDTVVQTAVTVYRQIADSASFYKLGERIVTQDTTGIYAGIVAKQFIAMADTSKALAIADQFVNSMYKYEVRSEMLSILLGHDRARESWSNRFTNLLEDHDPRIRFQVLRAASFLGEQALVEIEKRMEDEYDARVYLQMKEALASKEEVGGKTASE